MKDYKHRLKDRRSVFVKTNNEKERNEDFKRTVISAMAFFLMMSSVFLIVETGNANSNTTNQLSKVINQTPNIIEGISGGNVLNVVQINGGGWEYYQSNVSTSFSVIYRTNQYQSDYFFNSFGGVSFNTNEQYVKSTQSSKFVVLQWVVVNPTYKHPIESQQIEYFIKESMTGWFIQSYNMTGFAFIDAAYQYSFMADLSYQYGGSSYNSCSCNGVHISVPIQVPIPVDG